MRTHPRMDEFHHSGSALASPESLTTIAMRSTLVAESGLFQILGNSKVEEMWVGPSGRDE
jgi:hypothetical protein